LVDYDALFAEKLNLLRTLNEHDTVTWSGRFRPAMTEAPIAPRPVTKLPIWLGAGGTPSSAERAGDLGLPLTLANIMQPPAKFVGQIAEYRRRHAAGGHDPAACQVAVATHVHVAKDSQTARDEFYPYYAAYFRQHAPRTNLIAETPRDVFEARASASGPIFVGSPQEVVDKLMHERELFGIGRFLAQVDLGGLPYSKVAQAIELLATEVLPAVRG
jgi:alkanesulfonate monooxygenase SsuD/methylene tetrahydromethanopterin reductase-like flavin-dependent oxidoreductase (luciferase family)